MSRWGAIRATGNEDLAVAEGREEQKRRRGSAERRRAAEYPVGTGVVVVECEGEDNANNGNARAARGPSMQLCVFT